MDICQVCNTQPNKDCINLACPYKETASGPSKKTRYAEYGDVIVPTDAPREALEEYIKPPREIEKEETSKQ